MNAEKLYHYQCKNPNCEREYALREVVLTGTLNRPTCARSKVIDVVDRKTREGKRVQAVYYVCGPRPCRRSRENVCHCGTPFDWPTQPADVSRDHISPEFQDLLDRMCFDAEFARGVRKTARDYSSGNLKGIGGVSAEPEVIELEIEVAVSGTRSQVGGLSVQEETEEEEELVA